MENNSLQQGQEERLRESIEQLVSGLRGKQLFEETLNQLVQQLMSTITITLKNQPKTSAMVHPTPNQTQTQDLGTSVAEEAKDDEYATVYFRVIANGRWFATQGSDIYSVGREPRHPPLIRVQTLALGSYLVQIIDEGFFEREKRFVHYLDTLDVQAGWRQTHTFIGSPMCFFFVANYKIYGLEFSLQDNKFSFRFLDFNDLDQGWQPDPRPPPSNPPSFFPGMHYAFSLEYDENTNASHASIFTPKGRIFYDFKNNMFSKREEGMLNSVTWENFVSQGVCVGRTLYQLCEVDGHHHLLAYNHHDQEWCDTSVIGLDPDVLPDYFIPYDMPYLSVLLHLGKNRLCIVWPLPVGPITLVLCTKFDVYESEGKHYAQIVSTKVYRVTGTL